MKYALQTRIFVNPKTVGGGPKYFESMNKWDASWTSNLSKAQLFDSYSKAYSKSRNALCRGSRVVKITDKELFEARLRGE